jgi:hypothetical protein
MNGQRKTGQTLTAIKLLHSAVWAVFSGCILAIAPAAAAGRFRLAAVLIAVVLAECTILAVNRCRCPLTDVAGRYTEDRADNFDIYLPLWLARHNKTIFGVLFAVSGLCTLFRWLVSAR